MKGDEEKLCPVCQGSRMLTSDGKPLVEDGQSMNNPETCWFCNGIGFVMIKYDK